MNVVILHDYGFLNGGAGKVAFDTAKIMRRSGHRVILFTAVDPVDPSLTQAGVEVVSTHQKEFLHYPNRISGGLAGLWNQRVERRLRKLLNTLDPRETVVHVHSWTKALSASVFRAVGEMHFPMVITGHDYFLLCPNGAFYDYQAQVICHRHPLSRACLCCNCDKRSYAQKLYRSVRLAIQSHTLRQFPWNIIYISDFSRQVIEPQLPFPAVQAYFAHNPVSVSTQERMSPAEQRYFIYIGRVDPEKGVDLFCEAIRRLGLEGIVIGEGSERARLMAQYQDYDGLTFTGWLQQKDWQPYLRQGRALVFPSKWYESAPLTVLETQSHVKLPAIVPDQCAASEHIIEGENGTLFHSGSLDSLIDAIRRVQEQENTFFRDAAEPAHYAARVQEYAPETYGRHIEEIYREILAHHDAQQKA